MKKYEKNIDDRKVLVARLSELTGLNARYTRVPRCAYEIGAFTVEKDGCLTVDEGADGSILHTLAEEGLIGAEMDIESPVPESHAALPDAHADIPADDISTEDWDEEEAADGTEPEDDGEEHPVPLEILEEAAFSDTSAEPFPAEEETCTPEPDEGEAEAVTERTPEEAQEEAPEETPEDTQEEASEETPEEAPEEAPEDFMPDTEYAQEAEEESAASLGVREAGEDPRVSEAEEGIGFPMDAEIAFPLEKHTAASLVNLVCTIYTRGPLISKATGGEFGADAGLVSQMTDHMAFRSREDAAGFIKNYGAGALRGIRFEEDRLVFDGFRKVKDDDHLRTFTKLAEAINKTAITRTRILAKESSVENEKYAMRTWLIRIGMDGSDTKEDRKRLMENLTGHTAFRTPADEEKWKARQQVKRDALRAAKAETAEAE